ncbi:hypothetical protein ACTQV2_01090 [Bifidobacterium thermophilum]|uniref:hypothetical protein n=1 Tax=Bifidobacterium thermophilum TaxID=33905 RepID=UPI003F92FF5C
MPTYTTSDTMVSKTAVARLVADGLAKEWRNPRTGGVRHYIDADGLGAIIGFEQTYYHTGNISGVSYIDGDGDRVSVAHSRGYHRDDKTFIEDGTVYCSWTPYGANIAELVARKLAEKEADRV